VPVSDASAKRAADWLAAWARAGLLGSDPEVAAYVADLIQFVGEKTMSGLWRCENCGDGTAPNQGGPEWRWAGDRMQHKCAGSDPQAGHFDCRWFGEGNGHPGNYCRDCSEALPALVSERGALVSSADCSSHEIAMARDERRFFVDGSGFGYVLRPKDWLVRAEQYIFDAKDSDDE